MPIGLTTTRTCSSKVRAINISAVMKTSSTRLRTLWVVFLLQCSLCSTFKSWDKQSRIKRQMKEDEKDKIKEKVITEGHSLYLICSNAPQENNKKIYWKKDGHPISHEMLFEVPNKYFPIVCATFQNVGNYTCHTRGINSTEKTFQKIVLRVLASQKSPCGEAEGELWQERYMCTLTKVDDYPCCKHYKIPSPENLHSSPKISSKLKKCESNLTQIWKIHVQWSLPKNATYLWGWTVSILGLDLDFNYRHCVIINSKDKLLEWTFDGLQFGAKYMIKVDALPSDGTNKAVENVVIPTKRDLCEEIGRKCAWEICIPVENVKINENDAEASFLSWRPSKHHETQAYYEIYYESNDANCSHNGKRVVQNATNIRITDLKLKKCNSYNLIVRPFFLKEGEGTFSKAVCYTRSKPKQQAMRSTDPPPTATSPAKVNKTATLPAKVNKTYIVISCSVAAALLMVFLILLFTIKRRRRTSYPPNKLIELQDQVIINPDSDKTTVFLVHDNHCPLSNNVTHALAHLLNQTGCIKCVLDLCSMNAITDRGMSWYVDSMNGCDKYIVICTKEGKKIFDKKEKQGGTYVAILSMLLGRMMLHPSNNLQVFPVHLDKISSEEDVPLFLSGCKGHSLPSQWKELLFALHPEIDLNNCYDEDESNEMKEAVKNFKNSVDKMKRSHSPRKKGNNEMF